MAHGEVSSPTIGIHSNNVNSYVAFHSGQATLAAQNFNMPALSPTMTEGNIATWKIKEGTTDRLTQLHITLAEDDERSGNA